MMREFKKRLEENTPLLIKASDLAEAKKAGAYFAYDTVVRELLQDKSGKVKAK